MIAWLRARLGWLAIVALLAGGIYLEHQRAEDAVERAAVAEATVGRLEEAAARRAAHELVVDQANAARDAELEQAAAELELVHQEAAAERQHIRDAARAGRLSDIVNELIESGELP